MRYNTALHDENRAFKPNIDNSTCNCSLSDAYLPQNDNNCFHPRMGIPAV